jgi:hypothetical protein
MTTALDVVAVAMSCLTLGFVTGWTMRHRITAWQVTQLGHELAYLQALAKPAPQEPPAPALTPALPPDPEGRGVNLKRR